jgi:hypothetical protein
MYFHRNINVNKSIKFWEAINEFVYWSYNFKCYIDENIFTFVIAFPIWYVVCSLFIVNVNKVSVYFKMDCAKLQKVNTSKSQLQMSTLAYLSPTAVKYIS